MVLFPILILISFCLLFIATTWKIFEKANEKGWLCLIPVINAIIFLKIVGKPWWWLFLMCIPLVNYIFIIWALNMFSKSFGKDDGFTAGLFFFGFIYFPIIAFGSATYQGPYGNPTAYENYRRYKMDGFDFEENKFEQ